MGTVVVVIWIVSGPAGYFIGQRKGRGVQGLVLGLLLGLVGLVVTGCLSPAEASQPTAGVGPPLVPTGQSFYAFESIAGYPLFLLVLTVIAINAIPDRGGRPIGIGAAVLALILVRSGLHANYAAIVCADGALTFKSLLGSTTTAVSNVLRLAVRTGGRGGARWYFVSAGGTASLDGSAGQALARYVISHNPSVTYPPRWDRRKGLRLRS